MGYTRFFIIFLLIVSCVDSRMTKKDGIDYRIVNLADGSVKIEQPLKNGKPFGVENQFYKSGNIRKEASWYQGIKYGHQFEYYDDG